MMLARSVALLVTALSAVSAWPIFFYDNTDCNHYPVLTVERPPPPNQCFQFGRVDVKSYSGGTRDNVQKVLLYDSISLCEKDAAHRAYANHTINNNTNLCLSLSDTPRAFVFIEEFLGPIPEDKTPANVSACAATPALRVQN